MHDDETRIVPAGKILPKTQPKTSAAYDGSFDEAELVVLHTRTGQYPFPLASAGLDGDVFKLWFAWMIHQQRRFTPEALPWVPVGRAGPLLVLGHCHPDRGEAPPLPDGVFQPVLLTPPAYQQQLRALTQLAGEAMAQGYRANDHTMPDAAFGRMKKWASVGEALEFAVQHLVWERSERSVAVRLTEREQISLEELPAGLRSAVWFLLGRGPVVDVTSLKPSGELATLVPPDLKKRVTPIYQVGKLAFLATSETDRSQIEDKMHAAMHDEGWQIRFVMHDAPAAGVGGDDEQGGDGGKVFVGGVAPSEDKAVVTITLDTRVLERIDLRSTKNEPKDVFLALINMAIREGASDLHIEPGIVQARVRLRKDGVLYEVLGMTDAFCRSVVASGKSQMGMPSEMFNVLDAECSVRRGDAVVNLRVSAIPIRKGYQDLVLRLQHQKSSALRLDNLDQPPLTMRLLRHAISRPQGLILVCGPTGSGKTTTLHACLAQLNVPANKILTLEQPIEYQVEGLMQAAVDERRGVTFEKLEEAFLRQDPDIVLLGEIRNEQTADIAVQLALTGHIVFATMHTLSSAKAIMRITELKVKATVLAEALLLVQSQRLARRLCPKCREPRVLTESEKEMITFHKVEITEGFHFVPGKNCGACKGTGYAGRIAVMDVLPSTKKVRAAILRGADSEEIEAIAAEKKFPTLVQEALRHALAGNITLEEALLNEDPWDILETEDFA